MKRGLTEAEICSTRNGEEKSIQNVTQKTISMKSLETKITVDHSETGYGIVDYSRLAQDWDRWRSFWTAERLLNFL